MSRMQQVVHACTVASPIGPARVTVTAAAVCMLIQNPTAPIQLYINSPGGVVTAGLAIYDTMQAGTASLCMNASRFMKP